MTGHLIDRATVLTMDAATGATPVTRSVRISDGAITAVAPHLDPEPGETVIDGRDRLLVPGWVNAHTHSWEGLFRARCDNLPLEHWLLLAYPVLGLEPLSTDLIRLRTALVAIESLRGGVTTVVDDVLEVPGQSAEQLAAVMDTYRDIGIRANVSGHVVDRPLVEHHPYLAAGLDDAGRRALDALTVDDGDALLEHARQAAKRYGDHADGRVRFMVGPSAPQRCTPELLVGLADLADEHDLEYHIHVLETRTQAVAGAEFHDATMIEYLHGLGVLSERVTVAHGIWLTESDIDLLADTGTSVSHNPLSNLKLGSGIAPWRRLHDAGVNVAIGTDGMSSSDTARVGEAVKCAALLHKVTGPDFRRWPTVGEVLHAGTLGGARSARLGERVGSVEVGKRADLVLYDMTTLAFTPRNRPELHLVYSENGSSIDTVFVDGRIVLRDGELTTVDERAVLDELQARGPSLRAWQDRLETLNRSLLPAYDHQYARVMDRPLPIDRYSGRGECWLN